MFSNPPERCRCGCKEFIEFQTGYKCKSCGYNFGKAIAKSWVEKEINGKMKVIETGRIRPGWKITKRLAFDENTGEKIESWTTERTENGEKTIQRWKR